MTNKSILTIIFLMTLSCMNKGNLETLRVNNTISIAISYKCENFDRKCVLFYSLLDSNLNKITDLNYFHTCYDGIDFSTNDFSANLFDSVIFIKSKWNNKIVSIYDLKNNKSFSGFNVDEYYR